MPDYLKSEQGEANVFLMKGETNLPNASVVNASLIATDRSAGSCSMPSGLRRLRLENTY